MEPKVEKKEQLSPEREAQEVRLKEIEILKRQQELDAYTKLDQQEIQRRELEIEQIKRQGSGWHGPIDQLLSIAMASCIDNGKSYGSEAVFKSIWDEDELEEIKSLILKKARKL